MKYIHIEAALFSQVQSNIGNFAEPLFPPFLGDVEIISPVEEVEDSKDSWEEDPREDVNLLGCKLEVVEPGNHPVGRPPGG